MQSGDPRRARAADGMNPSRGDPPTSSKIDPTDAMANTMAEDRRIGDGMSRGTPLGSSNDEVIWGILSPIVTESLSFVSVSSGDMKRICLDK